MENPKIVIIDYGVGNLYNLKRAFGFFGVDAEISEKAEIIKNADALVLPGVGSFEAGMSGLNERNLVNEVREAASRNKPILGICLGAQLMLSKGYEFGTFDGLNLIPGKVIPFPAVEVKEKIPHIGWNGVYKSKQSWDGTILNGLKENNEEYFVHSFILEPDDKDDILSLTRYGDYEFCSSVRKGNIYGCQFHPEKSGEAGLAIIKNFINLI